MNEDWKLVVFESFFFVHLRSFYHADAEQGEKDSLFNKGVGDSHKKIQVTPYTPTPEE